jgi:hypothetical protein
MVIQVRVILLGYFKMVMRLSVVGCGAIPLLSVLLNLRLDDLFLAFAEVAISWLLVGVLLIALHCKRFRQCPLEKI